MNSIVTIIMAILYFINTKTWLLPGLDFELIPGLALFQKQSFFD